MTELGASGVQVYSIELNNSSFDEYVAAYSPDVVFFDRFMIEEQFGWRVRAQCPNALRILDTIDLHSLRRSRQKNIAQNFSLKISNTDLHSEDSLREISSMYRCDLSLITSDAEMKILKEEYSFPSNLLELTRMCYSIAEGIPRKDFLERKHIVTIGNFNHPPNLDSYQLLKDRLWKDIRAQIIAKNIEAPELHVYGSYSDKYRSLDDPKLGFRIMGWAEDSVEALANYRVNVAPLRFGAGVKGKVLDGWIAGTPCVGSPVAAEGLHQGLEFGGWVADNLESFIRDTVDLYSNQNSWRVARDRGFVIMKTLFDEETNAAKFISALEYLTENKVQIRESNFIGAMLWHHQFRSTEYFSRWIELKNTWAPAT